MKTRFVNFTNTKIELAKNNSKTRGFPTKAVAMTEKELIKKTLAVYKTAKITNKFLIEQLEKEIENAKETIRVSKEKERFLERRRF